MTRAIYSLCVSLCIQHIIYMQCLGPPFILSAATAVTALSDWLRRCRTIVGEVRGATFVRLMESIVESVLLYGAEVWGCGAQLGPVQNVQMRVARIFLGVGRLTLWSACNLR